MQAAVPGTHAARARDPPSVRPRGQAPLPPSQRVTHAGVDSVRGHQLACLKHGPLYNLLPKPTLACGGRPHISRFLLGVLCTDAAGCAGMRSSRQPAQFARVAFVPLPRPLCVLPLPHHHTNALLYGAT